VERRRRWITNLVVTKRVPDETTAEQLAEELRKPWYCRPDGDDRGWSKEWEVTKEFDVKSWQDFLDAGGRVIKFTVVYTDAMELTQIVEFLAPPKWLEFQTDEQLADRYWDLDSTMPSNQHGERSEQVEQWAYCPWRDWLDWFRQEGANYPTMLIGPMVGMAYRIVVGEGWKVER